MREYVIFLIGLICFCSCGNQLKQNKLISNNHNKYWDILSPDSNQRACKKGYLFNSNGSYDKFYYYKNRRYTDKVIDIVYDRSWKTVSDSSFILSKKNARVILLTEDTFIFQLSDKSIVKLIASQNQTDSLINENPFHGNIIWDTLHISR